MTQITPAAPALRLDLDGPLAWIVADNAPRMNAFTASMWEALPGLVSAAEADDRVRVLILRGRERAPSLRVPTSPSSRACAPATRPRPTMF